MMVENVTSSASESMYSLRDMNVCFRSDRTVSLRGLSCSISFCSSFTFRASETSSWPQSGNFRGGYLFKTDDNLGLPFCVVYLHPHHFEDVCKHSQNVLPWTLYMWVMDIDYVYKQHNLHLSQITCIYSYQSTIMWYIKIMGKHAKVGAMSIEIVACTHISRHIPVSVFHERILPDKWLGHSGTESSVRLWLVGIHLGN